MADARSASLGDGGHALRLLRPGRRETVVGSGRGGTEAAVLRPGMRGALPRLRGRAEGGVMATATTTTEELTAGYLAQLAERTPRSHELRRAAEQVLAGGVSSHFKAWQPFYVREAKGAHLTDLDGNDYVDLIMGFGPNSLGHSPDVIVEAVRGAAAHGTSLAIATPLEVELAQTISRLVPSMEVMRFVVSGTEATMMALRTARAFTGRQ